MYRKIIIFGMNYIGDTLFVTPLIRALGKSFPKASIDIVNGDKGVDVLLGNKHINEIIVRPKDKNAYESYIEKLSNKDYDIAFIANTAFYAAYDAYKAKIPIRVGLNSDMRWIFLTHKIPYQKHREHIVDGMLALLEPFGIKEDGIHYDIELSEKENEFGKAIFKGYDKVLLVHPGATRPSKRYPVSSFAKVIEAFYRKTQMPVFLIGGKDDVPLCEAIEDEAKGSIALNLSGKYNLRETMAIIKQGHMFLGGDSAPLHIANAFSLYTFGIYGDTLPIVYGVRGEKSVNISGRAYCGGGKRESYCRHCVVTRYADGSKDFRFSAGEYRMNKMKSFYCEHIKRGCKTIECLRNIQNEAIVDLMTGKIK